MAENALVLKKDAVATDTPHTFPGFPGEYAPGQPVALEQIGLTPKEAKRLIKELNLPLELSAGGKKAMEETEELPIPGRHYDEDALQPGENIPFLPAAGRVHSSRPDSPLPTENKEGELSESAELRPMDTDAQVESIEHATGIEGGS